MLLGGGAAGAGGGAWCGWFCSCLVSGVVLCCIEGRSVRVVQKERCGSGS